MFVLRQINMQMEAGAQIASEALSNDVRSQFTDMPARCIMELAGDGKFSSDYTQVAASGSFALPLPQNYVTTNLLHIMLTSDQTVQVTITGGPATSNVMLRAGANQVGVLVQCGTVTGITVANTSANTANLEWFLFELPNILVNAGWRDAALVTGLVAP